ncbi:ribosomal protein S12 methylthiotransferase accessory factor [Nonomuraea fuscirosea]|uniref:Ribosomal protein S12 methylthiotransferase accessory factor n=1 Tax=Nonomuraea fuscirosea TaxID=1291556 RepID=A0A2T0N7C3_9ACTN|nr:YcaO-like family protein [Nonomuraea fuscirosea]PRX68476.1 ribosomal protein S12 methylthiotransferase accessory factor [Nonomuraea fuscirosea]
MKLRTHVPKVNGHGVHREITAEETWSRVEPHLLRAGITRVADITWLDRIGIPVYNAISPRSNDIISVYNGKGMTPLQAKTSAVMEAMERFSAWLPRMPAVIASYRELRAEGRSAMHPAEYLLEPAPHYSDDLPISWAQGHDLLSGEPVLVPQDAAGYVAKYHEAPCYRITTTNGLASGNSLEEAVCHALCEVIERDAITISELLSTKLGRVLEGDDRSEHTSAITGWLKEQHPHVDIGTLPPRAKDLVARVHEARLEMRVVQLTNDIGVPTFAAATTEALTATSAHNHAGFGTHPDAEVAIVRAISECAQGRAVDIQAMREDISLPGTKVPKHMLHVHRSATVDENGWLWKPSGKILDAREIPSYRHGDVMDDVRFMLDRLRAIGMTRAIVVDLSPPQIPVSVVRLLVPGLESWGVDHSRLGRRAATAWNRAVRTAAELDRRLSLAEAG